MAFLPDENQLFQSWRKKGYLSCYLPFPIMLAAAVCAEQDKVIRKILLKHQSHNLCLKEHMPPSGLQVEQWKFEVIEVGVV